VLRTGHPTSTEIIEPTERHMYSVILLHDRDSNAAEFKGLFSSLKVSSGRYIHEIFPGIRWVFPSACTLYNQRTDTYRSQWFDMWDLGQPYERPELQAVGLRESFDTVYAAVRGELGRGVLEEFIVIGGIGQGCAAAAHALLGRSMHLRGFIALCGWMTPLTVQVVEATENSVIEEIAEETIMFVTHNRDDSAVPFSYGYQFQRQTNSYGFDGVWTQFDEGGHWINEPKGVDSMVGWLRDLITAEIW
jgi:predicted esterase